MNYLDFLSMINLSRLVSYTRDDGTAGRRVQLYVLDMGSANGTFVNSNKIEPQKYVQLFEKVLTFLFII